MYFRKRHATHHRHEHGRLFAYLALTTGLGNAAFWTIFPLVAQQAIGSEALVGVFFTLIALLTFAGSLASTVLFRHISRVRIAKASLLVCALAFAGFMAADSLFGVVAAEVPRSVAGLLVGIVLSLYVRDFASRKQLGLAEGRYYLFANLGWLVGPLLGGAIGTYLSRDAVFLFSGLMYLFTFLVFHRQHLKQHPMLAPAREEGALAELWENVKDYFKNRELWKVSGVAFGINYWWAISGIYIPIYALKQGYSDFVVGIVIAGGMLPLVLLEEFVGKFADKHAIRWIAGSGFVVIALITLLFNAPLPVPLILFLMAAVNIGAALVEPLQEVYLFSVIERRDEERFYGVYNIAEPVGGIIAPAIAAVFLALGGMAALWYGSAVVLLGFAIVAFRARR